jgi:hypothetical protein
MEAVASEVKPLQGLALKRTDAALAQLRVPDAFDFGGGKRRLQDLMDAPFVA